MDQNDITTALQHPFLFLISVENYRLKSTTHDQFIKQNSVSQTW